MILDCFLSKRGRFFFFYEKYTDISAFLSHFFPKKGHESSLIFIRYSFLFQITPLSWHFLWKKIYRILSVIVLSLISSRDTEENEPPTPPNGVLK